MATLWFDTVEITFHPVAAPLSRWKAVMAARMPCSSAAAELRLHLFRCFGISFLHFWRLLVRLQKCRPFRRSLGLSLLPVRP